MKLLLSLLLLIPTIAYGAGTAFSQWPSTNVVNSDDLLLLDSHLGGTNYATRTVTVSLMPAANWVADGTTNSTLAGVSSAYNVVVTNQITSTGLIDVTGDGGGSYAEGFPTQLAIGSNGDPWAIDIYRTGTASPNHVAIYNGGHGVSTNRGQLIITLADDSSAPLSSSYRFRDNGFLLIPVESDNQWGMISRTANSVYALSVVNDPDTPTDIIQWGLTNVVVTTPITSISYTSGAPSGGTAAAWKLGSWKTNAVTVIATNYVEVEIGGVLRKLAVVQ